MAKIKLRFAYRRKIILPRHHSLKNKMERSTAFCQDGMAAPFINKHCLTVATFPFLWSTATEYCVHLFLFLLDSEKGAWVL